MYKGLLSFEQQYPQLSNARGSGMFLAIDLTDTETRNRVLRSFYDHDMLSLASGSRSLRFRPALSMTKEEAHELLRRMQKTFDDLLK